jgi:murein DD-endopeptidase MepM/ murein hydrolase activator NlpD
MPRLMAPLLLLLIPLAASAVELRGEPVQGGLIFGQTDAGSSITLDGEPVPVSEQGEFVIGFNRDETGTRTLRVSPPSGPESVQQLVVAARDYQVERVDGLPPRTVTPDPEAAERIRQEARMVATARARRGLSADYNSGFSWPAAGRISGVYGSQRVLNGEPRRPHFGLDIAAPTGSEVRAPADGVVTLTHPDMYFSGGTIILDHGEAGASVRQGDLIGHIGATGRASGPHLDWRMNWLDRRVDPQPLVPPAEDGMTP